MGEDAVFLICPQMGFYLLVLLCMMKYSKLTLQLKSEDFSFFCSLSGCVTGQSGSGELLGTGRSPCLLRSLGFFSACSAYSAPWQCPEVLEAVTGKRSQSVLLVAFLLTTKAVVLSVTNAVPHGVLTPTIGLVFIATS